MVLAVQRYGKGKAHRADAVQDTWLWRMHARMDVKDQTHHLFWQRWRAGSWTACRIA